MTSPVPFVDVCGFPGEGDPVHPTARAARHLVAAGWVSPEVLERLLDAEFQSGFDMAAKENAA